MRELAKQTLLALAVILASTPRLEARPRSLVVAYNNLHLTGNQDIQLSRDIASLFTDVNVEFARPVLVTLRIKDRLGLGEALFTVGGISSFPQNIPGTPQQFATDDPATFSAVTLRNPSAESFLPWIIELQGDVIVHEVTVILDDAVQPRGEQIYDLVPIGSTPVTTRIPINRGLSRLIVQLAENTASARIDSAIAHLPAGAAERLGSLEGALPQPGHGGRRLEHHFPTHGGDNRIQDVIIRASGRSSSSRPAFIEIRTVPATDP
jgi:hypothetical protein